MKLYRFTNAEIADIIKAMEDAQNELACGPGLPEGTAQWERWEQLLQRLKFGAVADA